MTGTTQGAGTRAAAGRSRVTLGAWLALAFSVVSVLLTGIVLVVIERTATEQIRNGIGNNVAELAFQMGTRLDRGVFERYREMELLARRISMRRTMAEVQAELTAVQSTYRFYGWVGLADTKGVVRAASRGMLLGADVTQRPWFQRGQSGQHLTDVHDAVLLASLLQPSGSKEPMRFFDVAFPVMSDTGVAGVLGAHVSWKWAEDLRSAIFRPRPHDLSPPEPVVVNREGEIILGPPGLHGQKLQLDSLQRAAAGENGFTIERWPDGVTYLVGFSRTRGYDRSPGLGWTVLVRDELEDAHAPVRAQQRRVLTSGVVVAVLFSVLGWLIARLITAPLLDIARTSRALEAGRVDAKVPTSEAYAEVALLGSSLNALVSKLQQNEEALRELNADLEQRVQARTAELSHALATVRASEQRIRTILEAAQDPFIGMDLEGRIIDWNSQAEVVFGWPREDVIGRRVSETLLPPRFADSLEQSLQRFLDTGDPGLPRHPIERLVVDRSGREIPVEIKVGLVATGEQRFFSAFVHDISQRKEIERLKDEFVATVSHELRTPLTATYGALALLRSGMAGELPADARELVEISHASTERLIRLINDLLDVEKIASGKIAYRMQPQAVRPLVEQALRDTRAYAESLGVRQVFVAGADAEVVADADRIVQVCVNLLSNAAKFSPRGGQVEVTLSLRDGQACISVADQGPGIPPEFHGRVFERFSQADASARRAKGGTGLGLSICRGIVEAHGGHIDFESEPGVRTVFWFTLPLATAPARDDAQNDVR